MVLQAEVPEVAEGPELKALFTMYGWMGGWMDGWMDG